MNEMCIRDREGEHNIGEIADMSGFSETKYFREVFKKYYRMSPSTYAKEGKSPVSYTHLWLLSDSGSHDDHYFPDFANGDRYVDR